MSALVLLLVTAACGEDAPSAPVTVRFAADVTETDVDLVEVSLVEGGCGLQPEDGSAPNEPVRTVRITRDDAGESLGEVEPGRDYLYARAFDATCTVIGAGCGVADVEAGGGGELVVEIAALSGPRCGSGCDARCQPMGMAECGDGILSAEHCDDANATGGDGCDVSCRVEPGFTCTIAEPSACTPL